MVEACSAKVSGMKPILRLPQALGAWGTPAFKAVLKGELEQLDPQAFPLQEGLSLSSYALYDKISAVVIAASDTADQIQIKAGIFYAGVIAGCSCADDPTPVEPQIEYCEVMIDIDKGTGEATVSLLPN
jgi:hypothetical protein